MTREDVVFVNVWNDSAVGGDPWRGKLIEVTILRRLVLTLGVRMAVSS